MAKYKINKKSGKNIIYKGTDSPNQFIESLSTGVDSLDFELSVGGLPRGRMTEIMGLESSCKTSLALWMIGKQQQKGLKCVFVDAEHALNFKQAEVLGVDLDKLTVIQGDTGEENIEAIEELLENKKADLIVIDSIPSLIPQAEIEADINAPTMGRQARLIAAMNRRIIPLISKNNTVLICLNQLRMNIMGGQWDPYISPGGMSMRFYATIRISLHKKGVIKKGDKAVGDQIEFQIRKNKVGMPKRKGVMDFMYNEGFRSEIDYVEAGLEKEVLHKKGNTYFFKDEKLAVGKDKTLEALQSNPDLFDRFSQELEQSLSQS